MSDQLARYRNPDSVKDRWEQLYDEGERQKIELEEMRRLAKADQDERDKEVCSFRPQLETQKYSPNKSSTEERWAEDAHQRGERWVKRRERKIQTMAEEDSKQKLGECTFKPCLAASAASRVQDEKLVSPASLRSVEKYIKKQKQLKAEKDEGKRKTELTVGSGNLWNKRLTVPKAPSFVSRPNVEILHVFIQGRRC